MLSLVTKLHSTRDEIDAERGGIVVLALFQRDGASGKVDILFSAAWISREEDERPALDYFIDRLRPRLTDEELAAISVIVVLRSNDPFVNLVLDLLRQEGNPSHLTNVNLNGMLMTNAYIIAADLSHSSLPAAKGEQEKAGARDRRRRDLQPSSPQYPATTHAARSGRAVARGRKLPAR